MKPTNYVFLYGALTALAAATSVALLAAAYLFTTYALNAPGRLPLPY